MIRTFRDLCKSNGFCKARCWTVLGKPKASMSVRINPAAFNRAVAAQIRPRFERASIAALGRLERNIQAGERSGIFHEGNERQSSAPGEFPQEQTGALLGSLDFRMITDFKAVVGALNNAPFWAHDLENLPASAGGRSWLKRTMFEPETRAVVLDAIAGR
jgi:hypothetical protein